MEGTPPMIALRVVEVTGAEQHLRASPSDTVAALEEQLHRKTGRAMKALRLAYGDLVLHDDVVTLSDLGIGDGEAELRIVTQQAAILTRRRLEVGPSKLRAAVVGEAEAARQALEDLPSHMMLCTSHDKHMRHFRAVWEHGNQVVVRWGKNADGSDHCIWTSCASAPPKQRVLVACRRNYSRDVKLRLQVLSSSGKSSTMYVRANDEAAADQWQCGLQRAIRAQQACALSDAHVRVYASLGCRTLERLVALHSDSLHHACDATLRDMLVRAEESGSNVVDIRHVINGGDAGVVLTTWLRKSMVGTNVTELNLGGTGTIDLDGASALADYIPSSSLKCLIIGPRSTRLRVNDGDVAELTFEGHGLAAPELKLVAATMSTHAALNSVSVDSTGTNGRTQGYTLTMGEEKIDLSQKNLGFADTALVAAWLQRPEVRAVLNSITLDGCLVTGTTFGSGGGEYQGGRYEKIEKLDADLSGFDSFLRALKSSRIVGLSLQKCYLGPKALAMLAFAIKFMAVVAHLALGSNPIGDEAMISLLDIVKDIPLISFDISNTGCGVSTATKLAELLSQETKFKAELTSLKCANNPGMVGELYSNGTLKNPDVHVEVFKKLTDGLKTSQVTEVDFSSCGIGPVALGHVSDWVREATTVLNSVTLDSTGVMQDECGSGRGTQKIYALAVGEEKMDLSQKNLGPADVVLVATWLQRPEVSAAPVKVVILDGNPIGHPTVSMQPGANTGVPIKSGTFVCFDGRIAEVHQDPDESDSGKLKKLKWVDSSEGASNQGNYIKASEVSSCVGNRSDLIFDYSHIQALGETLSKVEQLSLADCKFTSATLATFVKSVTWANAVVDEMNVSMNPIGVDGAKALAEVLPESSLKCLIIGPKSTRLPVNDSQVTELDFEGQIFTPAEVTLVAKAISTMAALTSVNLHGANFGHIYKMTTSDLVTVAFTEAGSLGLKLQPVEGGCKAEVTGINPGTQATTHSMLKPGLRVQEIGATSVIGMPYNKVIETIKSGGRPLTITFGSEPCTFQMLCDALKTSQVTEVDFSSCGLGSHAMEILTEYVHDATAAVARLTLDSNELFYGVYPPKPGDPVRFETLVGCTIDKTNHDGTYDVNVPGVGIKAHKTLSDIGHTFATEEQADEYLANFYAALKNSNIIDISLANTKINSVVLRRLATSLPAALNSVTVDSTGDTGTHWDDEQRKRVSNDQIAYTLTASEENIDLSSKNLGPADVTLVAAWLTTDAGAASLRCGNNHGMVGKLNEYGRLETPDVHAEVFKELTDSLKTSQVTEADFSACGIGPVALGHLSDWVREATAVLNSLTVDSTGNMYSQKTYTLTAAEDKIDLSSKNLGPVDVALVATWLQRPEVSAVVNSLQCGNNPGMARELEYGRLKTPDAHAEVFKQLTDGLKTSQVTKADFSACGLGPVALGHLSEWVRDAEAVLTSITLDGQAISGSTPKYGCFANGIDKVDANLTGFKLLCDALGSSQIEVISMKSCYLGPEALALLADAIKLMAALNSVTINSTGLRRLSRGSPDYASQERVDASGPRTYTLTVGEEKIDLSQKNLGSADVALVAAWLVRPEVMAVVASLRCGNNPGMVGKFDDYGNLETPDAHAEVFKELTDSLKTSQVTEADFSSCGIGPVALGHLGEWVREARAVLNSLTLDSTGDTKNIVGLPRNGGPKTYTLTTGEEEIDLSSKNLGPADVALVATWIQRPKVSAAVASLDCSQNDAITGKRVNDAQTAYVYGEQLEGWQALCSSLSGTSITSLNFSECRLTPEALTSLGDAIKLMAAGQAGRVRW